MMFPEFFIVSGISTSGGVCRPAARRKSDQSLARMAAKFVSTAR